MRTKSCLAGCCPHPIGEEIDSPRITHEGNKYFVIREEVVCCRCGDSTWRDKKKVE
jgi:hypothetical protein